MTKLKEIREQKGMTQAQLAELSGISLRMVQYYEQGRNTIDKAMTETSVRLADALMVDVHDLMENYEE